MLLEVVGVLAMLLILGAYAFSISGHLSPKSWLYQGLNLLGSSLFIVYLSAKQAWSSVALNVIWAVIALVMLVRRARLDSALNENDAQR